MIKNFAAAAFVSLWASLAVHAGEFEMYVPERMEGFAEDYRAGPAVRAGDFVHISGVVGYIPPDEEASPEAYEAAIRNAFERVGEVLKPAGASWDDVIEMTTFHVNMRDHQEIFVKVREEFITGKPYPAWTGIGVEKLWADPLFVEIRVIAYLGE